MCQINFGRLPFICHPQQKLFVYFLLFYRYRFMHSIGNPVDLSRPEIISQTQAFYQYAIVAKNVIDPTHHPCLESLPEIFLKAMQSVSSMVDAFIGISNESKSNQRISRSDSTQDNFPPQGI